MVLYFFFLKYFSIFTFFLSVAKRLKICDTCFRGFIQNHASLLRISDIFFDDALKPLYLQRCVYPIQKEYTNMCVFDEEVKQGKKMRTNFIKLILYRNHYDTFSNPAKIELFSKIH